MEGTVLCIVTKEPRLTEALSSGTLTVPVAEEEYMEKSIPALHAWT